MSRLLLPWEVRDAIERDSMARLPLEACGVLVGRTDSAGRLVTAALAEENVHEGDRRRSYRIKPERLLAIQKAVREEGFEVVGYYHSHPDSRAIPSAADLETAWPDVSYLIVGIANGQPGELRSWTVDPRSGGLVEETVQYEPA